MGRSYVMGQLPAKACSPKATPPPAPAPSGCSRGRRYWSAGSTARGASSDHAECKSVVGVEHAGRAWAAVASAELMHVRYARIISSDSPAPAPTVGSEIVMSDTLITP